MRKKKKFNLEERFQEMMLENVNTFSFLDTLDKGKEKDFSIVKGKKIFEMRQIVERKIQPLMVEDVVE